MQNLLSFVFVMLVSSHSAELPHLDPLCQSLRRKCSYHSQQMSCSRYRVALRTCRYSGSVSLQGRDAHRSLSSRLLSCDWLNSRSVLPVVGRSAQSADTRLQPQTAAEQTSRCVFVQQYGLLQLQHEQRPERRGAHSGNWL